MTAAASGLSQISLKHLRHLAIEATVLTDEASCCDNFAAVLCKQEPDAVLTTEQ
jgi:hypothetical protein